MQKVKNGNPEEVIIMSDIGIYTGKTLDALRKMTQGEIRTEQNRSLDIKSKKKLIEIELSQTEFPDPTTGEDSSNGQVWRLTVIRDAEGNILRKERYDWTYYPTGEVNVITTTKLDANNNVISTKQLKHYDGRQPEFI